MVVGSSVAVAIADRSTLVGFMSLLDSVFVYRIVGNTTVLLVGGVQSVCFPLGALNVTHDLFESTESRSPPIWIFSH
jgi:hypothetical protein